MTLITVKRNECCTECGRLLKPPLTREQQDHLAELMYPFLQYVENQNLFRSGDELRLLGYRIEKM